MKQIPPAGASTMLTWVMAPQDENMVFPKFI